MKPIYECCDIMLSHLEKNYGIDPIPNLDIIDLLKKFDVPSGRHEFFKGILNILIDDGYADFLDYVIDRKQQKLEVYKNRVLITPKGFQFIQDGGYTTRHEREISQRKNRNLKDVLLIIAAFGAAIGAISLVIWEMYKDAHSSCH